LTNKPPPEAVDRHAVRRKAREKRLAAALRANLKRRKAAAKPAGGQGDAPRPDDADDDTDRED